MSHAHRNWYTDDTDSHKRYIAYQQRYATTVRESDRILIQKISSLRALSSRDLSVLDVGCSSGNFLLHLSRLVAGLSLHGIDISPHAIDKCLSTPELAECTFQVRSAFTLSDACNDRFDIVIANAMVHYLSDADFLQVLHGFSAVLNPGGYHLNFDGFHPFEQDVSLVESCPNASRDPVPIHYRSFTTTSRLLKTAGLTGIEFHPFEMPFDLVHAANGYSDLSTRTLTTADGRRLSMRGIINQTWCHLYARKPLD